MTTLGRCCTACCLLLPTAMFATPTQAQAQRPDTRPASEARLPCFSAASGLLQLPSAYLQRPDNATLFAGGSRYATGGVLLGLGQRLEVGLQDGNVDTWSSTVVGNAKFSLLRETLLAPAMSIGVLEAFQSSRDGQSGYVVVSKSVIPYFVEAVTGQKHLAVKVHAGYGSGRYRNRPLTGLEIWGDNGIGVLGEVASGRAGVGARYYRAGFGITLGLRQKERLAGSVCYTIASR